MVVAVTLQLSLGHPQDGVAVEVAVVLILLEPVVLPLVVMVVLEVLLEATLLLEQVVAVVALHIQHSMVIKMVEMELTVE